MSTEIRHCVQADRTGKVLYHTLDFPVAGGGGNYHVPLSDQVLRTTLPEQELAQICRDTGNHGYYLSVGSLQTLQSKLDPSKRGLALPAQVDRDLAAQIQWLLDNPPPVLETDVPNTNQYVMTSMRLDPVEVAIFRHAIADSLDVASSFLRRIPNPLYGPTDDQDPARYAISVEVDATQYDKVLFYLSQFLVGDDVQPETQVRVALLQNEIQELKAAHLKKRAPEKPLPIPDSYFGRSEELGAAREQIAELEKNPPQLLTSDIDLDDYTLFREPLFSSDIAFLRWKMGDKDNSLFVNYNGHVSENPDQTQAFYIKRDIDRDQLIAGLAVLESSCRTERLDEALCNRVGSLVKEAERIDRKIKEESFWHKIEEGLPIAIDFVGLGAGLGVAAKGPALVKWIVQKMGGPKGPPSSGNLVSENHPTKRQEIPWNEGLQAFGWGFATLITGAATAIGVASTVASATATAASVAVTPGVPDEIALAGLTAGLSSGTATLAAMTFAEATAFYVSASHFLRSIFLQHSSR